MIDASTTNMIRILLGINQSSFDYTKQSAHYMDIRDNNFENPFLEMSNPVKKSMALRTNELGHVPKNDIVFWKEEGNSYKYEGVWLL
jgi:hypothetical protein